jgi:hypothetical protein
VSCSDNALPAAVVLAEPSFCSVLVSVSSPRSSDRRHPLPGARSSLAYLSGLIVAFGQPGSEKLPAAARQLIPIEQLAGELEVLADAHDQ